MAYPTPTARRRRDLHAVRRAPGAQGNVINAGVNELVLPDYKHTWANIRKISNAPAAVSHLSFKSKEFDLG